MPKPTGAFRLGGWIWAVYVIYCIEAGLVLMLFPWSNYWEFNYFAQQWPSLRPFWVHGALRGAVSGLGLALMYMGLEALIRRDAPASSPGDSGETS